MARPRIRSAIVFCSMALACCANPDGASLPEAAVDLRPSPNRSATVRSILPASWTRPRIVEITTSPAGATLDLFYLRGNVQLRFLSTEAPARVVIPARLDATRRDVVLVRATLDGYRVAEQVIESRAARERHAIELEALPNRIERFAFRDLGGRATLLFATREPLRFQLHDEADGFRILLPETALADEARTMFDGLASELVARIEPIPIGEDLVIRVTLRSDAEDHGLPLRGRRWRNPADDSNGFAIDVGATIGDVDRVARLRAALAAVSVSEVSGCALAWERSVRSSLDPTSLARALGPSARDGDAAFRHEAMRRLGELVPDSVVRSTTGATYRVDREIEAMAASSVASEVVGHLALLRSASSHLADPEHRGETLRGLLAPGFAVLEWNAISDEAERSEQRCRAPTAAH